MEIIVIRHGQSELIGEYKKLKAEGIPSKPKNLNQFFRIAEIYESNSDSSLNEKGQEQILDTADELMQLGYPISRAYISPTKRAKESYEIIAEKFARQGILFPHCKIDSRIDIIEAGIFHGIRGTESDDKIAEFFNQKDQRGLTGKEFAHNYLTGETILHAVQRIYNFLDDTKGIWKRKNILIVTHKSTMRVIHSYFEHDLNNNDFFECEFNNGEIKMYGEVFKGKMTSKEAFDIKFRNFISEIPTEKARELSEFFCKIAKKGINNLDKKPTQNKSSQGDKEFEL